MEKRLPELQISNKVIDIPEALSVYMNNIVYSLKRNGEQITILSLGEAFFKIPMFDLNAINFEKGYHYSESMGLPELRMKIADYYKKQYDAPVSWEKELLISSGSKPLIYMALQAILNEGDEVLIHEPAWLSYPEQIKLANGVPKFLPYDCRIEKFKDYFTEKTKVLIINNPNNPSGKVYSEDELRMLYENCRSNGIYILVDEAYSDFLGEEKFVSMINIAPDKDGIVVINSLSKNLGVSGWRVGYVISNETIIYNILKLNQHLLTCAPTVLLDYLAVYFDDLLEITLPQAKEVVGKRNSVERYLKSIGLECLPGSATFYIFINLGDYKNSSIEFGLYLLFKYNIAIVPGSAYGESTERFIRVGVGAETSESIMKAFDVIKKVIDNNEYDEILVNKRLNKLGFNKF